MTFEWKYGLIWISVDIEYDGKCYTIPNCIVDTGAATTAIDIDLVEFNYQKPSTIKRLVGVGGGTQEVVSQQVNVISVDHSKLYGIEIEFGDIKEDLGINGFVGTDILSNYLLRIDFTMQTINLDSP